MARAKMDIVISDDRESEILNCAHAWLAWIRYNHIDMQKVSRILAGKNGKQNTLHMVGPPSSGKTLFTRFLLSGLKTDYVGVCTSAAADKFMFGGISDSADVIVMEETIMNLENCEMLKMICEGNDWCKVDVKYKAAKYLKPRPVIWNTNYPPWRLCQGLAPAFKARMYIIRTQGAFDAKQFLQMRKYESLPEVKSILCDHLDIELPYHQ